MDKTVIQARIKKIRELAKDDPEAAHSHEDELLVDVLKHIAQDGYNASFLAEEVLKVRKIKFSRWCA